MSSRGKVPIKMMIKAEIAIVMMIMIHVTNSCKTKNLILSETKNVKYQKISKITLKDIPQ